MRWLSHNLWSYFPNCGAHVTNASLTPLFCPPDVPCVSFVMRTFDVPMQRSVYGKTPRGYLLHLCVCVPPVYFYFFMVSYRLQATLPAAVPRSPSRGMRMAQTNEEKERALTNMARAARKVGPNDRVVELRKVSRLSLLVLVLLQVFYDCTLSQRDRQHTTSSAPLL